MELVSATRRAIAAPFESRRQRNADKKFEQIKKGWEQERIEKLKMDTQQRQEETQQLKMHNQQLKMRNQQLKMHKQQLKMHKQQLKMESGALMDEKDRLAAEAIKRSAVLTHLFNGTIPSDGHG